ncbi:hypothetical protein Tco_0594752 [Tanacetum coccineum]
MANLEFCDKHNMVAYLKKPTRSEGFQEIVDFLNGSHISFDLTKNPTIYVFLIEKFWQTATVRIVDNGEQEITATVDGKEFTITEASVRRHLQLADVDGFSGEQTPLFPSMLAIQAKRWGSPRCQETTRGSIAQTRSKRVPTPPHDSPLPRVNTLGSDKGSMQLQELMALCTKLSDMVLALETDLRQTKKVYGAAYTKLILKVKKLEKTVKSNQARRRAKIVVLDDEEDLEDFSKQGRMIEKIDQDAGVTLVTPTHSQEDQPEDQRRRAISTGNGSVSTTSRLFSTAGASMPTKLQQRQERAGYEAAVRLQEHLDEEERQRIARMHKEAKSFNIKEWENIQAKIKADKELA